MSEHDTCGCSSRTPHSGLGFCGCPKRINVTHRAMDWIHLLDEPSQSIQDLQHAPPSYLIGLLSYFRHAAIADAISSHSFFVVPGTESSEAKSEELIQRQETSEDTPGEGEQPQGGRSSESEESESSLEGYEIPAPYKAPENTDNSPHWDPHLGRYIGGGPTYQPPETPIDPPPPPPEDKKCCCAEDLKAKPKVRATGQVPDGRETHEFWTTPVDLQLLYTIKTWKEKEPSDCSLVWLVKDKDKTGDFAKDPMKDWYDEMKTDIGKTSQTTEPWRTKTMGIGTWPITLTDTPGVRSRSGIQRGGSNTGHSGSASQMFIIIFRSSPLPCDCEKRSITIFYWQLSAVDKGKPVDKPGGLWFGGVSEPWPPNYGLFFDKPNKAEDVWKLTKYKGDKYEIEYAKKP